MSSQTQFQSLQVNAQELAKLAAQFNVKLEVEVDAQYSTFKFGPDVRWCSLGHTFTVEDYIRIAMRLARHYPQVET